MAKALARQLMLPTSSASILVKDLHRRGFVTRARDASDERRLSIVLRAKGRRRVRADSVLDLRRLEVCRNDLPDAALRGLLRGMEQLTEVAGRKDGSVRAETP